MKRALTVIAAVTIGVLSTLVLQNTVFAEYPVDPHQVCIDVVDTDYEGAYNTASGPFTWKCFLHTPGDLEEAESQLDIAGWCIRHHNTSDTIIRDQTWFCARGRFW